MKILHPLRFIALLLPFLGALICKGNDSLPQLPEEVFPELGVILDNALEQSPRMIINRLNVEAAEGSQIASESGLYPSISGYYNVQKAHDEREDLPGRTLKVDKTYYGLSLTQPLFHWGERKNTARMGEIQKLIADRQYEEGYRILAVEIRKAYLNLISTKSQLVNAQFARKLADEALRAGEERAAKKLISEGEVFPLRMAAEQAAYSEANLELNFETAGQQFETLTGQSAPALEALPSVVPMQHYERSQYTALLNSYLGQSNPNTPAFEILRNQVEISRLSYENQRKRLLPKLNFIAGITQDDQSYTINSGLRYGLVSRYFGLSVNWQIFDGLATRGAVRSALAQKRVSEENYRQAIATQQHQAESAARGIDLANRHLVISEKILDNSQVFLRFRQEDFKRGNASESDVSQAQANYYSTLVSANNARINYMIKVMELVSLVGRDPVVAKANTK